MPRFASDTSHEGDTRSSWWRSMHYCTNILRHDSLPLSATDADCVSITVSDMRTIITVLHTFLVAIYRQSDKKAQILFTPCLRHRLRYLLIDRLLCVNILGICPSHNQLPASIRCLSCFAETCGLMVNFRIRYSDGTHSYHDTVSFGFAKQGDLWRLSWIPYESELYASEMDNSDEIHAVNTDEDDEQS